MKNNEDIYLKLKKEVKNLEYTIKHPTVVKVRNLLMRGIIQGGIHVDRYFPYFLAGVISISTANYLPITPFETDQVEENMHVETIDTSQGIHVKHLSFDHKYSDTILEYSTGWKINNNDLYERISTTYQLNEDIDINNAEEILNMSKEEIESLLTITNIETIYKDSLLPDDYIYQEDALILINHYDDENMVKTRNETNAENRFDIFCFILYYCISTSIFSFILVKAKKLFLKLILKINY